MYEYSVRMKGANLSRLFGTLINQLETSCCCSDNSEILLRRPSSAVLQQHDPFNLQSRQVSLRVGRARVHLGKF
jgi:hypothetical protein